MERKGLAKRITGSYGIFHVLTCPTHGLLALALKAGLVPGTLASIAEVPHNFITHKIFEPVYQAILDEEEHVPHGPGHYDLNQHHGRPIHRFALENSHECSAECGNYSRAGKYAHTTTDALGWGSLAGFLGLSANSLRKRRSQYLKTNKE